MFCQHGSLGYYSPWRFVDPNRSHFLYVGLIGGSIKKGPKKTKEIRIYGGRGGIRTHGGVAPTAVFKTAALNHSATLPERSHLHEAR
jgi:hypothetical protein